MKELVAVVGSVEHCSTRVTYEMSMISAMLDDVSLDVGKAARS